jgi:hypothetical protein
LKKIGATSLKVIFFVAGFVSLARLGGSAMNANAASRARARMVMRDLFRPDQFSFAMVFGASR